MADQAAALLLDRVRGGEWALGAKIPGENTLAGQLGVGRSTVREAIRQLAGRGVLSSRQGAGVFVASLETAEDRAAVMRRASIVAVIEARVAIEAEAAALAADRRTPAQMREIRRALAARAEAVHDAAAHVDADLAFHRAVVAAAGNPVLIDLYDLSTPRMRESMIDMLAMVGHFGSDADHAAHVVLADAVAERRANDAAHASREHLTAMKEAMT